MSDAELALREIAMLWQFDEDMVAGGLFIRRPEEFNPPVYDGGKKQVLPMNAETVKRLEEEFGLQFPADIAGSA